MPPQEVIRGLGLPVVPGEGEHQQEDDMATAAQSSLPSVIPLLTFMPQSADRNDKGEPKPSRFLVAKGLPTLPMKLVDKAWNKEYVDMEEFLPTPHSLRLAEQRRTTC